MITLILLIAALICFILSSLNIGGKINLTAVGLACWVATELFGRGIK